LVAFALLATLVDKMVGTRASTARLRAATKEELNTPIPNNMPDDDHEDQPEEEEQQGEEGGGGEDKVGSGEPTACRKCDELKAPNAKDGAEGGKESSSEMSGYLVGFAKRVVVCTILVFAFKSVWPQVQNHFWPEPPEGKCYVLNDKSFKSHVSKGDHIVMMFAPWCGHCQRLKPTWDKIAKRPGIEGVKVAKVDCTASEAICKQYDVKGYPTILYFRNGKKLDTFSGDKSETGLKEYITSMKKTGKPPAAPSMEDMMPPPPPPKKPTKAKKKTKETAGTKKDAEKAKAKKNGEKKKKTEL